MVQRINGDDLRYGNHQRREFLHSSHPEKMLLGELKGFRLMNKKGKISKMLADSHGYGNRLGNGRTLIIWGVAVSASGCRRTLMSHCRRSHSQHLHCLAFCSSR
jgi:hypothetical protein